jgi:ABC-type Fe3+-siderophore transport system permease subunit
MRVVNATERRALSAARQEMWMAAARAAGSTLLVAVAVLVAMGAGASPLWWVLVGVAVSVLADGLREAWISIQCERDVRRCSTCRAASIGLAEASRIWDRCSGAGHPDPRWTGQKRREG